MRFVAVIAVLAVAAVALAQAPARTPELLAAGQAAYEGQTAGCHACHGLTGEGNGPVAFALNPRPRNFTKDPFKAGDSVEQIYATITNGLPNSAMVPFTKLSDYERWSLAYYVLSFRPHK